VAEADGYLQVLVANESDRPVWFDDVSYQIEPSLIVQETHYDPWGLELVGIERRGSPEDEYKFQDKELLTALALYQYDFGARYYDPQLGRWHTPDPVDQFASPYLAMGNNPVMLTDPDGRFVPLAIAAVVGVGAILNVASNWQAIASSPTFGAGLGRALGFAAVGGVSGFASLYNPMAGGAIQGVGNAALGGVINGDSFSDIVGNAVIGGITGSATSFAGAQLGGVLAPYVSKAFSNVTSPMLQHALGGLVGGTAVGSVLGGTIGAIAGENVWESALSGAAYGAASGLLGGLAQGYISARAAGFNPWNGRNLRLDQPEIEQLNPITDPVWIESTSGDPKSSLNTLAPR